MFLEAAGPESLMFFSELEYNICQRSDAFGAEIAHRLGGSGAEIGNAQHLGALGAQIAKRLGAFSTEIADRLGGSGAVLGGQP